MGLPLLFALVHCKRPASDEEPVQHRTKDASETGDVSALVDQPLVEAQSASEVFKHLPVVEWSAEAAEELDAAFVAEDKGDLHKRVLAHLLAAPSEERPALAGHVANLTPDGDYAPVAWLIVNGALDERTADPLLGDLNTRSIRLKLPVFAEILSQPDHPAADEAHRALITYLRKDFSVPSAMWKRAVDDYLSNNPAEY